MKKKSKWFRVFTYTRNLEITVADQFCNDYFKVALIILFDTILSKQKTK
jgi:hypothetical protein